VFCSKDILAILDFILIYFWTKNSFAVISVGNNTPIPIFATFAFRSGYSSVKTELDKKVTVPSVEISKR